MSAPHRKSLAPCPHFLSSSLGLGGNWVWQQEAGAKEGLGLQGLGQTSEWAQGGAQLHSKARVGSLAAGSLFAPLKAAWFSALTSERV